jgi:hypothetical protein
MADEGDGDIKLRYYLGGLTMYSQHGILRSSTHPNANFGTYSLNKQEL